jgi:hypothetical protein
MNKTIVLFFIVLFSARVGLDSFAQTTTTPQTPTAELVAAAKHFLATLDEASRGKVVFNFNDTAQRKQAILGFQMRDLVLGPGRDGQTIQPEGIKGSALTERQREMLLDLANEWTGIMHEAVAKAKMDEMKQNIDETWFAWSSPTEKGRADYFRIQGPTVIIEYAPQRTGGDPTNEYGAKWWKP